MKAGFLDLTDADLRAHMTWLRHLAARLVRHEAHAEDAVQDTMVAALQHPPDLDRDVRPWLARVLANTAHTWRRGERRRSARDRAAVPADVAGADTVELLLRHEAARTMASLVSALREPHRTLVLLRFAEDQTPKEIARQRGAPEGTVRRQLSEALEELRAGIARHYDNDPRGWRAALLPLARTTGDRSLYRSGGSKEVISMAVKSKVGAVIGGSLVILLLAFLGARRAPGHPQGASAAATAAPGPNMDLGRPGTPQRRLRAAPTLASYRDPPPAFVSAPEAASVGAKDCSSRLAQLRRTAVTRVLVTPAAFQHALPSPANQREVSQIVDGLIAKMASAPAYHVECRMAICRVGVVTDPASRREPFKWFKALEEEPNFQALRGSHRHGRIDSVSTRDALTGHQAVQHWLYFGLPLRPDEEHPLEASATGKSCAERVAALEQGMNDQSANDSQREAEELKRAREFLSLPVNPELTRRVAAAFKDPDASGGTDGASLASGTWQCRGKRECRWNGPASATESFGRRIPQALATLGIQIEQVMARANDRRTGRGAPPGDGVPAPGSAEITVVLADPSKPPAQAGRETHDERVLIERTSEERAAH